MSFFTIETMKSHNPKNIWKKKAHPAKAVLIPENRYKSVTTMKRITGIAKEIIFLMSVSVFVRILDVMEVPFLLIYLEKNNR